VYLRLLSSKRNQELVQKKISELTSQANKSFIDYLFPPVCLNCLASLEVPHKVCPDCWKNIDFLIAPLCEVKGTPFPFDLEPGTISATALKKPPHYDKARGVAAYEGTMKELIHKLKYNDRHEFLNLFVTWMSFAGKELIQQSDLIVPIPLYKSRLWERRFNQSALLAKRLSEKTQIPYECSILRRQKKTRSQVGLTSKERYQNLKNAFVIEETKRNKLEGKSILVIDDVITTGATINSAAIALKKSGASSVNILSLAIVTNSNNQFI
jgi:ComF family protein